MPRAILILMLSMSWPLLATAADPAPVQADFEPKPLQSKEMPATLDTRPLRGPEDFILPATELAPRTDKDTVTQERVPNRQSQTNAPVLEGF